VGAVADPLALETISGNAVQLFALAQCLLEDRGDRRADWLQYAERLERGGTWWDIWRSVRPGVEPKSGDQPHAKQFALILIDQ
jgi:hypothetical protein